MTEPTSRDDRIAKKHHKQSKFCYGRPAYREAQWERAVKVYTINQESKYLLVQGIPSVGVTKELIELFAIYGTIEEYRYLHEYPCEEFTDVYWIKFQKIQAARFAKKKLDMRSFYGGILHVCYAPEYETVDDTREKLHERRRVVARKCREYYPEQESPTQQDSREMGHTTATTSKVIGSFQQPPVIDEQYQEHPSFSQDEVSPAIHPVDESKADSPFLRLPLPPINLPSYLLPPPQLPPPVEYPRVPTKDATLPPALRNLTYGDKKSVCKTDVETHLAVLQNSTKETQNAHQAISVGNKRSLECDSKANNDQTNSKQPRIVWHGHPGASGSIVDQQRLSLSEPGAWDPYAESRKKLKSLTGDKNLDDVALRIREKLKKVTEVDSGVKDNELKNHPSSGREAINLKTKTRKRI